ncbi:MAG: mechanosensitive ion channel family protein [Epsilonproteobacteria bacterium]|nr:MAG: mechanosensitive ion channel family protein [Campylobacterota bacterium]
MIKLINDDNATQETIMNIVDKQEKFYLNLIEQILANKNKFFNRKASHRSEVFALEKIIKLNERNGNKYAALRDKVLISSYAIIDSQNIMIKEILYALDNSNYENLKIKMAEIFTRNQISISSLDSEKYDEILNLKSDSQVIKELQENINDFHSILEVNADILKYISIYDRKIYKLNKYSEYHLIKPVLIINKISLVKLINSVIENYGFNIIQLILITLLIILVYFVRTIFYSILETYIIKIKSLQKYSKNILDSIRKLIETLIIFINIELVIYVYNDFVSIKDIDKFFNMIYGFIFTFLVYKIANAIAKIKVSEIDVGGNSIKFEIVNIGIKMVNFTIWIMGLLLILFLAGVNLTAVLSGLGIGGFAVALAAKDSLANFFGTLNILFSDMFSQGDWIKIDGAEGTVVEIGLRVTTLRTFDNALISIPNSTVSNKDVKNWDRRSLGRRIKMSIGVKYDSKSSDIQKAVDEIRDMLDKHHDIATVNTDFEHNSKRKLRIVGSKDDAEGVKRTLLVYLDEFGASSINILVYCFSKSVKWQEWLAVKQDVMFKMMDILEKNNLEFAFPSMSLYHENNLDLLEKK